MRNYCIPNLLLTAVLASASVVCASGDSDAVNERIPVRPLEKEEHWQINCQSSWQQLHLTQCNTSDQTARELQLCAMIYQPPGDQPLHRCPDYRAAVQLLSQQQCESLGNLLVNQGHCFTTEGE